MSAPRLNQGLRALTAELIAASPDRLGGLRPERILFVAGAARLASSATVRGFAAGALAGEGPGAPRLCVEGQEIAYEICLRPLYFLRLSEAARLRTICHELWHISPACDGRLAEERRHGVASEAALQAASEGIAAAWAERPGPAQWALKPQEAEIWAWLERPPSRRLGPRERAQYTEAQLYTARIEQR